MTILILGLLIFLGVHSVRIVAEPWRTAQIARLGQAGWKGLYSLASAVGLGLIIWGYGLAHGQSVALWSPPIWARHVTATLTALAFVLIAAAYVPNNRIKTVVGQPMVLGVQIWALAHLLANGSLAAAVLFGAFLVWAVVDFASARSRDQSAGTHHSAGSRARDIIVVAVGLAAWALFAFVLHAWLIGVRPLG